MFSAEPQTLVEKIFSDHVGRTVQGGEIVVASVDVVYAHDANRPHPLQTFQELGGRSVFDPAKVAFFLDHAPNVHTVAVAEMHQRMRAFAAEQGIALFDVGRGISHRVIPEEGYAVPGRIIVGSDSHTCTSGAFNLLATGVGSADLAVAMKLGKLWFKVPPTIRVKANGELPPGVYPKDLILHVLSRIGADGANYCALELVGSTFDQMSMQERMTITNMAIEAGAKFGVMQADEVTRAYLADVGIVDYPTYASDDGAVTQSEVEVDAAQLVPYVALPSKPDRACPVGDVIGRPIAQANIGTCTNGDIEDLRIAAAVLEGHTISPSVRLFVAPATRQVHLQALREGLVERFVAAGALWGSAGCSGCTGSSAFGVPADGENMISSAPRNFLGRTGNRAASIYLASPATVVASAIEGAIADPTPYLARSGAATPRQGAR